MKIVKHENGKNRTINIKMNKTDYLELSKAVCEVINNNPSIRQEYKNKGLSSERFRWDMLWKSGFNINHLYSYLNDNHIDTALRNITEWFY